MATTAFILVSRASVCHSLRAGAIEIRWNVNESDGSRRDSPVSISVAKSSSSSLQALVCVLAVGPLEHEIVTTILVLSNICH